MSAPRGTFYVTTPIYYVNDRPHIGHVYTTTLADVLARHHRMRGEEVFFLTGTDEHAAKVVDSAAEHGMTPIQWADRNAAAFRETFARLGMSNDDFIRTTEDRHKEKVLRYVSALRDQGDVYLGEFEGWYDAGQEEYVPENKAKEYDFKSPINGKPLVKKREQNWFFRLSDYAEPLLKHLGENPACVQPDARRNEVVGRIKEGLNDVPVSRTGAGDWGIRFPGDENHAIYVWIDALINYLSTVDTDERRRFWPATVHLTAKDILWFHAVIWPAMLMALRKSPDFAWVELPHQLYAHSFWISEGQKMSKSLGNFITLEKIDHYVETFGLDALRWFLATQGPMGTSDSDFAEARFAEVYNAELANTFGNCVNRVTNMTQRYLGGGVADAAGHDSPLPAACEAAVARHLEAMDTLALEAAGQAALSIVTAVDGYIDQTRPFTLAKDEANEDEVGRILNHCAEALRIASLLLHPFMPGKTGLLWERFGLDYGEQLADRGRGDLSTWTRWGGLPAGNVLAKGDPLFPRYQAPE